MIKALVINMQGEKERMSFQKYQLNKLNIAFERIEAVCVDELSEANLKAHRGDWQRILRPQEVACLYSHINCWRRVMEEQTPYLILEDDAYLSDRLPKALEELFIDPHKSDAIDHISFETRNRQKFISKEIYCGFKCGELRKLITDKTGAAAYVLYPKGAAKLLECFQTKGVALADAMIADHPSLRSFQFLPPLAIQLDCCAAYHLDSPLETQTSIAYKQNVKPKPKSTLEWIKIKKNRIYHQVNLLYKQFCNRKKAKFILLSPNKRDFQ